MRLYVAAFVLAGCTQGSPVKGHFQYRYPDGTLVPEDISGFMIQVYVENGDGFDRYPDHPIVGGADGTFVVGDVPDGPFWIRYISNDHYGALEHHDEHDFVDALDVLGRPDDTHPTSATPLMVDATAMAPWSTSDGLYFDCFENATEASTPPFAPALAAGDQQMHSQFDWSDTTHVYAFAASKLPYLMRAGDHVTISRESLLQEKPIETVALTQVLTTDAPAQIDGRTGSISGTFVDVARTDELAITVDPSQFEARNAPPFPSWSATAIVGPGTTKGIRLGPNLFGVAQYSPTTPTTTMVSYGNPFDPTWEPRLYADFSSSWSFGNEISEYTIAHEDRPLSAGAFTFEPLPPAGGVNIAGSPVGSTFEVTKGASLPLGATLPDGTSEVAVTVFDEHSDGTVESTAYFATDEMPIEMPGELFQSGDHYMFVITAVVSDGTRNRSSTAVSDVMTYIAR